MKPIPSSIVGFTIARDVEEREDERGFRYNTPTNTRMYLTLKIGGKFYSVKAEGKDLKELQELCTESVANR